MNTVKLEIEFGTPEYHESIVLRDAILRKPLNLEFTEEQLASEYDSHHLGIYDSQGTLIGCLVLKPIDKSIIKMRQVAIAESHQNKGYGQSLVRYSEIFAKDQGYKKMELNARITAIPFYNKLDYKQVGKQFEEVGIPHFKLVKSL